MNARIPTEILGKPASPGVASGSYLVEHLDSSTYHGDRTHLSCSLLKPLLESPAAFQARLTEVHKPTPSLVFGSLVHLLLLEPELARTEIAVFPGQMDGNSDEVQSFKAANAGRLVVDLPTFQKGQMLADKVANATFKGRKLARYLEESMKEVSIFFRQPETGLGLRIRPDIYHPDITFDLKTTRRGTVKSFVLDALHLSYDLSAAAYQLGRQAYEGSAGVKPFVFVAVQVDAPHSVFCLPAGSTFVNNGALKLMDCLSSYVACKNADHWPDSSCEEEIEISPWQQYDRRTDWKQGLAQAVVESLD